MRWVKRRAEVPFHPDSEFLMRKALILAIVTATASIAVVATPMVMHAVAGGQLDAIVCTAEPRRAGSTPPDDRLFRALRTLDAASQFPWMSEQSRTRASQATLACHQVFLDTCAELRDAAIDQAHQTLARRLDGHDHPTEITFDGVAPDWRTYLDEASRDALCTGWAPWMSWSLEHGVDARQACAVCASP